MTTTTLTIMFLMSLFPCINLRFVQWWKVSTWMLEMRKFLVEFNSNTYNSYAICNIHIHITDRMRMGKREREKEQLIMKTYFLE